MAKFLMTELVDLAEVATARLGAGTGAANFLSDADAGKFVKLVAESRYDLCAAGDPIEGRINSVETATQDNFSLGGVMKEGRFAVTFDGLQATPGTGTIALGDYVVCGTAVAKGTALTGAAKVCKATNQPGVAVVLADNVVATINAGLVKVADAQKNTMHPWRVVSLGSAGTGAVGTVGLIEMADD